MDGMAPDPVSTVDPSVQRLTLDDVDRRLVAELRADGRLSVNELAERVHIARATAYQRLARLRRDRVLLGFTARIDPKAVGLDVTAIVFVDAEQGEWRSLRADLGELPGVEWVGLTTGAHDFVLIVRAADMATLRDVVLERLQGMRGVRSTQTMFVLDEDDRRWAGPD